MRRLSSRAAIALSIFLVCAPARAEDYAACSADAQRLCPGVQPGGGRIAACFRQHRTELSEACKREILAMRANGQGPSASPQAAAGAPSEVPADQRATYAALSQSLDDGRNQFRPEAIAGLSKPEYFTDLLAANSNAGEMLLRPEMMDAVRLSLDNFKRMGLTGVKFALQYPLLTPNFPHAAEYLAFYKRVAEEARSRGLKILPHVTTLFGDTAFSRFTNLYSGLTPERFEREYRDMVHLVVHELHPDYLGLITEPDTLVKLTGLRTYGEPLELVKLVNAVLDGLDRRGTQICVGAGSWNGRPFADALARDTSLDAICIHLYPIQGRMLDNAVEMARIARSAGKRAWIDEAWLYKTLTPGAGNGVAAAEGTFGQDVYSFWQPLDIEYMQVINALARRESVSLLSFYWSRQFFAYLPAGEGGADWRSRSQSENRAAMAAMRDGRLSDTGSAYKALIAAP